MTDRSQDEIWGLTKRFNCFKTKWNSKHYSYSPFSADGRQNAQQAANTIGVNVRKDKTEKNFRRTFTMTLKHKGKNGIEKRKTGSKGNPAVSVQDIGRCPSHAAKIIQAQPFISDADKKVALRRLARLANSTRSSTKGAKAKAQ